MSCHAGRLSKFDPDDGETDPVRIQIKRVNLSDRTPAIWHASRSLATCLPFAIRLAEHTTARIRYGSIGVVGGREFRPAPENQCQLQLNSAGMQ